MGRRRLLLFLVVAVLLAGSHFLFDALLRDRYRDRSPWRVVLAPVPSTGPDTPPSGSIGAPDGPGSVTVPSPADGEIPRDLVFNEAHARAYAWLGVRADGGQPSVLDAAAAAEVPLMALFLARQEFRPGRGLTLVTPTGINRIIGPDATGRVAPEPDATEQVAWEGLRHRLADGVIPAATEVVEAHRCLLVPQPGQLRNEADGRRVVSGPGVWAALHRRADSPPAILEVEGDATYAVGFFGDDLSTVRLDGGLVIPGRFYRVTGSAVISGGPVGVHIRPLATVPAYHESPLVAPAANN